MGALYPDTSPFSAVTSSRYWMSGLVAAGAVMVLYALANWVLGRLINDYRAPVWWRVWLLCALPLLIGIPLITMTMKQPTLRLANAAYTTLATLIGLALALLPGAMAAERPGGLAWLALDGVALMLMLTSAVGLQYMRRWLATGATWRVSMMVFVFAIGVLSLLGITGLRIWRRTSVPSTPAVFTAGLCVAYLLMPLVHHLVYSDGYYYITDSDNFFARNGALCLLAWLIAAALALGVTRLREYAATRWREA
jgi:hypothetical protein